MTTLRQAAQQALEAHLMLREWIKAVPKEVVLPAMPGIDGDWLDEVEMNLRAALAQAAPEEPNKAPGMAMQALAGEIIAALLADEKDGGYDLTAGVFGAQFSKLIRRWANSEWAIPPAAQQRKPEHITNGNPCWCNPEIDYVDPETGVAVIVHKEPQ